MDLKEFISTAISAISAGVEMGRQDAATHGVIIGNALYGQLDKSSVSTQKGFYYPIPEFIEFDIAVSAQKLGSGKAEISVLGLDIGKIEGQIKNETVSHIRFKLPVHWETPDSRHGLSLNPSILNNPDASRR